MYRLIILLMIVLGCAAGALALFSSENDQKMEEQSSPAIASTDPADDVREKGEKIARCAGTAYAASQYYKGTEALAKSAWTAELMAKMGGLTAPFHLHKHKVFATAKEAGAHTNKIFQSAAVDVQQFAAKNEVNKTLREINNRIGACSDILSLQASLYEEMVAIKGKPLIDENLTINK